jgi:adenylosuccinate synthase
MNDYMKNKNPNVDIVVGLQYGSEAKGLVCQTIAKYFSLAVRVGGPNAGHTVRRKLDTGDIETYKMRHIPATILNSDCQLALSAGAIINPEVLDEEIAMVERFDPKVRSRLTVDPYALVIQSRHVAEEHDKREGTDMFDLIGSTREGVGAAMAERVLRRGGVKLAYQEPYLQQFNQENVANMIRGTTHALLEGSQGSLLSNIHSPYYPYCTSRDTNVSGIMAESGVPPFAVRNVIGVTRTYPIRVAGRSGPTGGKEVTWPQLSEKLGKQVTESTTVTKRTRRVFEFSMSDFMRSCVLNRPNIIALTFLNYINKDDEGIERFDDLSKESRGFIETLEAVAQAPVLIMSTSADTVIVRQELAQKLS